MDFNYIFNQLYPNKPLGTGVNQRGMEGISNDPLVWSSELQKFVPNPNKFDRLSPEEQAQYLFGQTKQNGIYSSGAPISQRITPNVPPDINAVNVQNATQDNVPNDSGNVDSQPYQPIQIDNRPNLQPSLITKLFNPKLASQFPNQPNASRQNMAQDNSPSFMQNILGTVPSYYGGLLGAEEAKALQSRANTQGLLGAAIGLLGGMGTRGTTAAQNIAGALSGGLQASQGAIQQGITSYGQQQQLMLQQRQQAGINAMKIKYPDLADEFDTNPAGAFRIISEREAAANKPTVVSPGGTLVGRDGKVLFQSTAADKAQGRILTLEEANAAGLPTKEGQKWQINANGTVDLITGTGPGKDGKVATSIEEYEYAKKDGYKGTYEQFKRSNVPSSSTNVNVYGDKILAGERAKGQSAAEESAMATGTMAADVRAIVDILKPYRGGGLQDFAANIGNYLPGTSAEQLATAQNVASSIRSRIAPALRVPGSGATSDFEAKQFLNAIPSLMQTQEGRELMAVYAQKFADRAAAAADIRGEMTESGTYSIRGFQQRLKDAGFAQILTPDDILILQGKKGASKLSPGTSNLLDKYAPKGK